MPFVTQVQCFKSKSVLATFFHDANRYYLLDRRYHLPLRTKIAWCQTCQHFTEFEDLYSIDEIETTIAELDARRHEWDSIDAEHHAKYQLTDREFPTHLTQHEIRQLWNHALEWRLARQSDGRCLNCKSTTGLVPVLTDRAMKHPARDSQWITCTICHISVAELPPIELFDANGLRIAENQSAENERNA